MRAALRDAFDVIIDAGRLLWRHWPVLACLALLGVAVRGGAHWLAVEASDHVGWLGLFLLTIVPLGYLIPVIVMLHHLGRDLPNVRALADVEAEDATSGRTRTLWHVMVSVLVPFLTVYVANNLLRADISAFQNAAVADEFNKGFAEARDFGDRVGFHAFQVVVMIVAIAMVVRFVLGRAEKRWSWLGLAAIGALVEVYYTSTVASMIDDSKAQAAAWVEDRRAAHWVLTNYDAAIDRLGWLASPVDTATSWLFGLLGSFDVLVIVPLAWLTVAAVVLGHQLAPEPQKEHRLADRLTVVPQPVRRGFTALTDDVRSRFSALFSGLRMLARAGLVPMLLFCLVYLLALRIPYFFSLLVRQLAGPTDTNTWLAFSPVENALGLAVSMVVLSALLAAAIDRMLQPALADVSRGSATSGGLASPTT